MASRARLGTDERPAKVLSCASCRARKVRCSKIQPRCTECEKADVECIYPSRKPTRRASRPRQRELLDRISRLEGIVGQVDPQSRSLSLDSAVGGFAAAATATAHTPAVTGGQDTRNVAVQSSSGKPNNTHAAGDRYMSGEFWSNLCEEVGAIRQTLEQSSGDEDDDENDDVDPDLDQISPPSRNPSLPENQNSPSGFILGNPDYHERQLLAHPAPDIISQLWAIYCRNCDPIIKILHQPTVSAEIRTLTQAHRPQSLARPWNALMFCIYFGAVSSLTPERCEIELGERQDILSRRYRMLAERALAAADYLNTNDLVTLQAFTIYTCMVRCQSHDRTTWALTALLVRLAQAMNLHRDGDGHRFSIYEAEMRRRLWSFVLVLDIRGSEDRGTENIVQANSFTTAAPTLVDDADFSPSTTTPLVPKATPADNIVPVCMNMCSAVFGLQMHSRSEMGPGAIASEDELLGQVRRLEEDFVHTADPTHAPSVYASEIARLVILKVWLAIQYPYTARPVFPRLSVSRDTMLRTAVSIMELSERAQLPPVKDRFAWWTYTYVQWHPLAVTLAELCLKTEGELVDRAWEVVERGFPLWRDKIADSSRGTLWRPIRKLMKRAKAAREAALMQRLSLDEVSRSDMVATGSARLVQPPPVDDAGAMDMSVAEQFPLDPALSIPGTMDLSLTDLPNDLMSLYANQPAYLDQDMDFTLWNEFLMETRQDYSPLGSGDSF
jgi:hypothetical protein